MKTLILSLRFYKKSLKLNLLTVVQIAITMLLFVNMFSLLDLYKYSDNELSDIKKANVVYYMPHNIIGFDFETDSELSQADFNELKQFKNSISISEIDYWTDSKQKGRIVSYSENAFDYYHLPLIHKCNFDNSVEKEYIEAILIDSDSKMKIGDTFEITTILKSSNEQSRKETITVNIKIIDKIKFPPQLLDFSVSGDVSYANLFKDYRYSVIGCTSIIISEYDYVKSGFEDLGSSNSLLLFDQDISKEDMSFNINYLSSFGKVISFSDMEKNQKSEYELSIRRYLPSFVLVNLIGIVSLLSSAIILTERSIGKLQILFLNGAQWIDCNKIIILTILMNVLLSGIPTTIILVLTLRYNLPLLQALFVSESAIAFSWLLYLCYFILATIAPMIILMRNKPEKIIKYVNRS